MKGPLVKTTRNTMFWHSALVLALSLTSSVSFAQHFVLTERNLLAGQYDSAAVAESLVSVDAWHPYPTIDDREAWMVLPERVRNGHIALAEEALEGEWSALPATLFLEFDRTGNRTNFQVAQSSRRERLANLVLGEVLEDRGRFLDDIVDGIWLISEETFWGFPAHLDLQSAGFGLPDVDEPAVDLFAAETGALIAWTYYLLGDRLDQVSPMVRPRMRSELQRRILRPNLAREDFWWMAFDPSVINNWNPWIASNWLAIALIAEDDPGRRVATVHKIMRSVDIFLNSYPDDGGCDEGPTYWTRSGGSLIEVLELLREATNGRVDIYDEPLIQEMGRYIVRSHVAGDYFVNFADARPTLQLEPAIVYRYGERINDESMMAFASSISSRQMLAKGPIPGRFGRLGRQLLTLFELDSMNAVPGRQPLLSDVWLPDVQFMAARQQSASTDGFFLAAKGGHNEENHNHNDVGNFVVYSDGEPVLIDLGPATYTRQTFSDDRYAIWNLQSGYHNVPIANGATQPDGAAYRAAALDYRADEASVRLKMDLAAAYPDTFEIESWERVIHFERGADIEITDTYKLGAYMGPSSATLMTARSVEKISEGTLELSSADGDGRPIYIRYSAENTDVRIEEIELDDEGLQRTWGESVSRVSVAARSETTEGMISVVVSYESP